MVTPFKVHNFVGDSIKGHFSSDPDEIRALMIYVDRLDYPSNSGISFTDQDMEALVSLGVAQQSFVKGSGSGDQLARRAHAEAFLALDHREPGAWVLNGDLLSFGFEEGELSHQQAVAIKLHNALPAFSRDVPYEDVLEFGTRFSSERAALRSYLDEFVVDLGRAGFADYAERAAFTRLDQALADHSKTMRESNLRRTLASVEVKVKWNDLVAGAITTAISYANGLPLQSAAVAGLSTLAANITLSQTIGIKQTPDRTPFAYLVSVEKRLF